MSKEKEKINFTIFEKSDTSYVQMLKESPLGNSEKTILLQDFLQFVSDFNSDKNYVDSGFLVSKLVRKVTKGTRELCFYHFPELTVKPYTYMNSSDAKLVNFFSFFKEGPKPFDLQYERNAEVMHRGEPKRKFKLSYNDLKLKNIMLVTFYDTANSGQIISYNVFHVLNQNDLFQDTTASISDETTLFPTIFPNHYADKICWGSTGFDSNLQTFFSENNYDSIKSIPYIYYNSLFNDDLLSSCYRGASQYKIKDDLLVSIFKYYYDNFVDSNKSYHDFEAAARNLLVSETSRSDICTLNYTVSSLFFIIGPISSSSDLYTRYFSDLKKLDAESTNSNEGSKYVHTISSYIKSRLAI